MKKTTYVIIAAILLVFAISLGITAYMGLNAQPIPMGLQREFEQYSVDDTTDTDTDTSEE